MRGADKRDLIKEAGAKEKEVCIQHSPGNAKAYVHGLVCGNESEPEG